MKTIDFEKLEMRTLSGKVQIMNVREEFAETIYARFSGLKAKLLAEKIYKGEREFDDGEIEELRQIAESGIFVNKLNDAIIEAIK